MKSRLAFFEQPRRADKTKDRGTIVEHFDDETAQMSIAADVALPDSYDQTLRDMELYLLRSIPGI